MGMFDKFRRNPSRPVEPRYPKGKRMYCIGDIHGRADLLRQLHHLIEGDASAYQGELQVLYLGDYIDRGKDSCRVIDILLEQPLQGFESIYLLGNHEQALLDFLHDPNAMAIWLEFGGLATLQSYGINAGLITSKADLENIRNELDKKLPASHRNFYENCILTYKEGSYYFVHAGIRPGVALDKQRFEDQLWIREQFTSSQDNHGAIIVHGHSITTDAELLPNRIGIDTGAFATGILTALVLEGSQQRLLQTRKS